MPNVSMTFINLPVADLKTSMAFYGALGFSFNPQFTDETAACMIINDTSFAMLLTHEKFKGFSDAPIPDAKTSCGLLVAVSLENVAAVDMFMSKALAAGGGEPKPAVDYGFMYQRTMADPDGHRWEPFYFDMSKMPPKQ
jgi:predicted lactoylglutathione lyase